MSRGEAFEALKTEISEKTRPIVFWTGAGLSAPVIPGWGPLRDALLQRLKDIARELSLPDSKRLLSEHSQIKLMSDMWLQFQRLRQILGVEAYEQTIKKLLVVSDREAIPKLHSALWELSPRGIVTLNLDLFTQRAAVSHPTKSTPIPIHPGKFGENLNVFKEKRPFVAYPHGHLDSPHLWTFTASELEQRMSDGRYVEWLTVLFRSTTVVFVGVTADDIAINSLLDRIAKRRVNLTGHYWLTHRNDYATESWAQNHGISVVRYENTTGAHEGLPPLLKELKSPVTTEDPLKEIPVVTRQELGPSKQLLSPDELVKESEETIRVALNAEAKKIFEMADVKLRDQRYSEFLNEYGRSVHRSWYASAIAGENNFIGYHLAEEVTGGAFGTVYKAFDPEGNVVAVKVLKADNFRKSGFLRNFRRGVNSLRILTERNLDGVIKFIDAAEIPPTLVMNWSDGRNLIALVESGQLDGWSERLEVFNQLARIIRTCHGLPERVLHRDIRPANIMVEDTYEDANEWKVVVLDFDLSWHKGAEDHSIMHSPAFGFLAPEQRGARAKQTTRSSLVDSYGLGMTIYYVCTGKNPFPDQHMNGDWEASLFRNFERASCPSWRSLPRRVARLVLNATRDDQLSRWTLSQIEGELSSLLAVLSKGEVPIVCDVVTEEVAIQTEHMRGYIWSDTESSAQLKFPNGLSLSLTTSTDQQHLVFNMSWANTGDQDWNRIERVLSTGLTKMTSALERSKWTGVTSHKQFRGFEVAARVEFGEATSDPIALAKSLDVAIGHATAVSSF